jgi:hypothetical protein
LEMAGGLFTDKAGMNYMFYHETLGSEGFTMEMAKSKSLMGPFVPQAPPIKVGKKGQWDSKITASFSPGFNGTKWLGYYIGTNSGGSYEIGLAYADSLDGPWEKSHANPVIPFKAATEPGANIWEKESDGFYTSGIQYGKHTNYEYYLYAETVSGDTDYGPMALWTAKQPEGPFKRDSYVIYPPGTDPKADDKCTGGWDCGGYSESGVQYDATAGLFYMMYAGVNFKGPHYAANSTKNESSSSLIDIDSSRINNDSPAMLKRRRRRRPTRIARATRNGSPTPAPLTGDYEENIGFAFSKDGKKWTTSKNNPIGPVSSGSGSTQAFAESHIYLPTDADGAGKGLMYNYHTQRWLDGPFDYNGEDVGVDLFVNWTPGASAELTMPLIYGRKLTKGVETKCEYTNDVPETNPQGGVFCPPAKIGLDGAYRVGSRYSSRCSLFLA